VELTRTTGAPNAEAQQRVAELLNAADRLPLKRRWSGQIVIDMMGGQALTVELKTEPNHP